MGVIRKYRVLHTFIILFSCSIMWRIVDWLLATPLSVLYDFQLAPVTATVLALSATVAKVAQEAFNALEPDKEG